MDVKDVDTARWDRIADLLPEPAAQEVKDAWQIGEQEGGLTVLVEGLLARQVPIGAADRAQISVLLDGWGMRHALTPGLVRCLGDGGPEPVQLLDGDGEGEEAEVQTGWSEPELAGLVLVPWIGCTRCGRVLLRAHRWEDWDDLSYLAEYYVIAPAGERRALRIFPYDAGQEAFDELLGNCPAAQDGQGAPETSAA
ncbi:hypothetical protein [Streptomyces rubellomurinus]|uniref:Uncharacterized protein n=1 Tax=Streptomyces sp. Y1 TaxID=3238634 RepID=A0AB39TR01_9ACTN|nr:hypothetical protein VM98_11010 [Streptomyces rubellomurinus subsp. indigoferus]